MLRWKLIANTRPYESIRVALETFTTYVTCIYHCDINLFKIPPLDKLRLISANIKAHTFITHQLFHFSTNSSNEPKF